MPIYDYVCSACHRLTEVVHGIAAKGRDEREELRARVLAFQRRRSLPADGIVGEETLSHLSTALRDSSIPRLSRVES